MSATRSPKVSERVAPKPADPQPKKKKHDDADGPDFSTLLRAWIESHRASLLDSLRRLGKQPIGSFFTCLVMAVALSLPMGLSLLLNNVERLGGSWQRAAQISLYLNLDASTKEGEALRDDIKNMPRFRDLNEYFNGKYYWRSDKRSAPHNAYTRMDLLNEAFAGKNWQAGNITSWQYKEDDTMDGAASTTARGKSDGPTLAYGPGYGVQWVYDREANQYARKVGGRRQADADGSPLLAKNVVVVSMPATVIDEKGRLNMPTTGRGKARLYRDGQVSDAVWRRHQGEALTFETVDGADLSFDRGTTWVEIVGDSAVFDFSTSSVKN